jgi:quinone-modifying oxidoreductase subunit QmoC
MTPPLRQAARPRDAASTAFGTDGSTWGRTLMPSLSTGAHGCDFGWRLQGRSVGVLPERSFKLVPGEHRTQGALDPYGGNLTALQACLQCGTCTANCGLAGKQSHFPRRQMNLFQLGQLERLLEDPTAWHCYNCGDCSNRCPSGAKPGRLMGAIRQMAVEHFAFPRWLAQVVNRPRHWWLMFAMAAVFVAGIIGLGGSLRPDAGTVHYSSMLPHLPLNLFFSALAGLALLGMVLGACRAWAAYQGQPLWQARPGVFLRALAAVCGEVLAHRRFSDCDAHRPRSFAHLAMFYGFLGLAGLAGVAALLIAVGGQYPFPAFHPLKVLGNGAAALLILGTAYFVYERWSAARNGDPSTYFDWLLLANLLLLGASGVLCETFRYWNLPRLAYPTYFLHLVFVFVLFVSAPYTKLAHVGYRTLALTSREYDALRATESAGSTAGGLVRGPRGLAAAGTLPVPVLACYPAMGERA